jgi:hypothetical protein
MAEYLNFDLQFLALNATRFRVTLLASPLALNPPPSHDFALPFSRDELSRILPSLSGGRPVRGRTRLEVAKIFGEGLFGSVFAEAILGAFRAARAEATRQKKGLRIRLDLGRAEDLVGLPWEYLRDPESDFLAVSRSTPIVRYSQQFISPDRLRVSHPLRILVMISNPEDVPDIDEATEKLNLERATMKLRERGLVEVDYLEDASLRKLQRTLRQKEYHIFHFIGHGAYDAAKNVGTLILEDPYDHKKAYPLRGEALARELYEEETLRLVVLNSCQGAASSNADPYSGIATSLLQRGIPAVVAQQFEISDRAAIAFSEEFYQAVAEGLPLEAAVSEGRRAIAGLLQDNLEWATPVLFLHAEDSRQIFEFPVRNSLVRLGQFSSTPASLAAFILLMFGLFLLIGANFGRISNAVNPLPPPSPTPIPDVDLVIRDIRLSPRQPIVGQPVAVFMDIENQGSDPSPAFSYSWQTNLADPATIITRQAGGLAPGGILYESFTTTWGWWGAFIAEARLDTGNLILERAEENDRRFPVRTNPRSALVVDFSEALPDGRFIEANQPIAFDAYAAWGFRLEAESDDPACGEVSAWLQFVGISQVVLTTGLPNDPTRCTGEDILITFLSPRPDGNPSGISRATVEFLPGGGERRIIAYADESGTLPLFDLRGTNQRVGGLILAGQGGSFERALKIRVQTQNGPLQISRLIFSAP